MAPPSLHTTVDLNRKDNGYSISPGNDTAQPVLTIYISFGSLTFKGFKHKKQKAGGLCHPVQRVSNELLKNMHKQAGRQAIRMEASGRDGSKVLLPSSRPLALVID